MITASWAWDLRRAALWVSSVRAVISHGVSPEVPIISGSPPSGTITGHQASTHGDHSSHYPHFIVYVIVADWSWLSNLICYQFMLLGICPRFSPGFSVVFLQRFACCECGLHCGYGGGCFPSELGASRFVRMLPSGGVAWFPQLVFWKGIVLKEQAGHGPSSGFLCLLPLCSLH